MAGSVAVIPPSPGFNPLDDDTLYQGITVRRVFAYAIDVVVVSALAAAVWVGMGLLGVLSFGLLMPLLPITVTLVPLAYHISMIAAPGSATIGMRLLNIRVVSTTDGKEPTPLQAVIQIVAFYGSVALTASFVLIIALFNPRRRTLHDILAGTVVINRQNRL